MNEKNTVLDIANEIRIDVYNKLQKIPEFNFQENTEVLGYGLNILAMDNYYFAFVSLDEDIEARKFIYVYQRNDICIELVGRVTYYAVPVAWFLPFGDNELVGRLDSESGDLGNMAIHIQDIINVFVLNTLGNGFAHRNVELYPFEEAEEILSSMEKEGKADNFTFPLYEKYILIFEKSIPVTPFVYSLKYLFNNKNKSVGTKNGLFINVSKMSKLTYLIFLLQIANLIFSSPSSQSVVIV